MSSGTKNKPPPRRTIAVFSREVRMYPYYLDRSNFCERCTGCNDSQSDRRDRDWCPDLSAPTFRRRLASTSLCKFFLSSFSEKRERVKSFLNSRQ